MKRSGINKGATSENTILIAGYPKSGNVWLTRLLGDGLNSSTHSYWYAHDKDDIAAKIRPGKYDIRRAHFKIDNEIEGDLLPRAHTIAVKALKNEKLIFIVRDPRDIAVSARYYFSKGKKTNRDIILKMNRRGDNGGFFNGIWNDYIQEWKDLSYKYPVYFIHFEDLKRDTYGTLELMFRALGIDYDLDMVRSAIEANSVRKTREYINKNDVNNKGLQLHHLRKGNVGDWRNEFTAAEKKLALDIFGEWLYTFGYEKQ